MKATSSKGEPCQREGCTTPSNKTDVHGYRWCGQHGLSRSYEVAIEDDIKRVVDKAEQFMRDEWVPVFIRNVYLQESVASMVETAAIHSTDELIALMVGLTERICERVEAKRVELRNG